MSSLPTITIERVESPERPASAAAAHIAAWGPCAVVAIATAIVGITGVRGADYPAHFERALVWERSGLSAWSNLWYAGHATPTYSVVAPPLMAWIGPFWVVALSSLVATFFFTRHSRELSRDPAA